MILSIAYLVCYMDEVILQSFRSPFILFHLLFYCRLQAEPETDEVYAQITLLPEPDVSYIFLHKAFRCIPFSFQVHSA